VRKKIVNGIRLPAEFPLCFVEFLPNVTECFMADDL
jgi:hypothetical protein